MVSARAYVNFATGHAPNKRIRVVKLAILRSTGIADIMKRITEKITRQMKKTEDLMSVSIVVTHIEPRFTGVLSPIQDHTRALEGMVVPKS